MSRVSLVGCGIFRRELAFLAEKNGWELDALYLDSALHNNLTKLSRGLTGALAKRADHAPLVFYGCCHPLMDRMLDAAHATRTDGQNCVEMLLGKERFTRELERGAYFLLEDWARSWDRVMHEMFGARLEIAAELFRSDRSRMLAVRTPVSGDFTAEAERASRMVGLPLEWTDVGLDHLEAVVRDALRRHAEAARTPAGGSP
ncbi:DUF1638 domain-containing protein [Myxococcota bacterium]|nr:DUF1638 domain-containing protein [Myxococcota bacterium]